MRAIVMLCMLLIAASAWAGTLVDDFSDGDFEGWTQSGAGNWRVENEELIFSALAAPSYLFMGETDWQDYTISVNARFVKHQASNCCGEVIVLAPRGRTMNLCYTFFMGTWQQTGQRVGAFYLLGDWNPRNFRFKEFSWDMDTWYRLKLTADGDEFQLYVDDELVLEYEDSTLAAGKVGFGGAFHSTTIHFDDVVITGDDVPDMNLSAEDMDFPVDPKAKSTTTWAAIKYQ